MKLQTFALSTLLLMFAVLSAPRDARAQITTYSDPALFQSALSGSFVLVNLDGAVLGGLAVPYDMTNAGPAALLSSLGVVSANPAAVVGGQAGQLPEPGRDRLIVNGAGSSAGGNLLINLVAPVDGFGARSNLGDGGRVRAFSEPNLGGVLLGEADMSAGGFGGLISALPIRSVEVTCDFNFDLICGVYDLQHGTLQAVPTDPEVALLLLTGLLLVGVVGAGRAVTV